MALWDYAGVVVVEWGRAGLVTSHAVTFSGLSAGTTYFFRVCSTDGATNATSPVPPATLQFTVPSFVATDTTMSEFAAGTFGCVPDGRAVSSASDGEVVLGAERRGGVLSAFTAGW